MWNSIGPGFGALSVLDGMFVAAERRGTARVPDLGGAPALLIVSDSSGEHAAATHVVYSFVVTAPAALGPWDAARRRMRAQPPLSKRRMAFKRLSDGVRWRALLDFLHAADSIPGLLVAFAVDKRLPSIVATPDMAERDLDWLGKYTAATRCKVVDVVHFVALLIAGTAHRGQDVHWYTDEDAIVPNPERLRDVTRGVAFASSQLLRHDLRHLRCGTTRSDDGSLLLEDLASVPDLAGGAVSELMSRFDAAGTSPVDVPKLVVPAPNDAALKARPIALWLADRGRALQRIVVVIGPAAGSAQGLQFSTLRLDALDRPSSTWVPSRRRISDSARGTLDVV